MSAEEPQLDNRDFRLSKTLYVSCLAMIGIFVSLFGPWVTSEVNAISMSAKDLNATIIFFISIGILSVVAGYFLSRAMLKYQLERKRLHISVVRLGSSTPLIAGGLVAGSLSVGWYVACSFFAAAAVALIVTFPTKRRWKKM